MPSVVEQTGFFIRGINSRDDPSFLPQGQYVWSVNTINRGGKMATRPGFAEALASPVPGIFDSTLPDEFAAGNPQGGTVFTAWNGISYVLLAIGGRIYWALYDKIGIYPPDSDTWHVLTALRFSPTRPIFFEEAFVTTRTNPDGTITFLPIPYPTVMICDGVTRTGFFDGTSEHPRHLDPTKKETPIATFMCWSGSRLWAVFGNRLRASDLGNPYQFTEESITAEGGFFTLPQVITGIGQTPDVRALLVFGMTITTTFASTIFDRSQWANTPDFQKILFLDIGCTSQRSIMNKYGMTWWYSTGGLVALDSALRTYRTSRIHYRDQAMIRSKAYMAADISNICLGKHENFMLVSVPSSENYPNHTWVMDETVLDAEQSQEESPSVWASNWIGFRPVQWIQSNVNGNSLLFCLSRDYVPGWSKQFFSVGFWLAFNGQRADSQLNGTTKRITCGWESKMMLFGAAPRQLRFIELDLADISGVVNVRIYYAGRRSAYFKLSEKQIIASQGTGGQFPATITFDTVFGTLRRQTRIIRTPTVTDIRGKGVQGQYPADIDRGFQVYVEWDGEMSIIAARFFGDEKTDAMRGKCEPDETTERWVDFQGNEEITNDLPAPLARSFLPDRFVEPVNPKLLIPEYTSK